MNMQILQPLVAVLLLLSGSVLSYGQSDPVATFSGAEQKVNDLVGSDYEAGDKLMARADFQITFPPEGISWYYEGVIQIVDSDENEVVASDPFTGTANSGDTVFVYDKTAVLAAAGTAQAYSVFVRVTAIESGLTGPAYAWLNDGFEDDFVNMNP